MSRLAIVLSGGGARGAYEVGVLSYALSELRPALGCPSIDFVCATSVGAVNGTWLASVLDDPVPGLDRLIALWSGLELDHVLSFGVKEVVGLHRVLLGGRDARGIFDVSPLSELVGRSIGWDRLEQNLASGLLRALTVTATHVATGRPVVFVDRSPDTRLPQTLPARIVVRGERITVEHVLASAAIPLVFPPVRIRANLYCDGGLRLNTPMAPALHLGADRLLVVGVSTPQAGDGPPALAADRFPGAPFLLGKVMNAFLLDHVHNDLEEVALLNTLIEDGIAVCDGFLDKVNQRALARGQAPRRVVKTLAIRPSVDIGRVAAEHLHRHRRRLGRLLGRAFLRLLDVGEGASSDLASYLLFDGEHARSLIELGRADAAARRDELAAFLYPDAS